MPDQLAYLLQKYFDLLRDANRAVRSHAPQLCVYEMIRDDRRIDLAGAERDERAAD